MYEIICKIFPIGLRTTVGSGPLNEINRNSTRTIVVHLDGAFNVRVLLFPKMCTDFTMLHT